MLHAKKVYRAMFAGSGKSSVPPEMILHYFERSVWIMLVIRAGRSMRPRNSQKLTVVVLHRSGDGDSQWTLAGDRYRLLPIQTTKTPQVADRPVTCGKKFLHQLGSNCRRYCLCR